MSPLRTTDSVPTYPTGAYRLRGDSLIQTTAEESYRADSTHASWRVNWVRAYCGEGF